MKVDPKLSKKAIFFKNFIGGLGWMIGATFGFAFLIAFFSLLLRWLGGLPVIGNFFANLIEATNNALEARKTLPLP